MISAQQINAIVMSNPSCSNRNWKNRGLPPIGYMKGMGQVFVRSLCKQRQVMSQPIGSVNSDALAWYGISAATPKDRFVATYTLLLGLGMMESSGNYTCSYDTSSGRPNKITADTAEGGLFQTSFDGVGANPSYPYLKAEYAPQTDALCLTSAFKEGILPREIDSTSAFGSGPGHDFQAFERACPAFAAEYAASKIRVGRHEWGPLNIKAAEYVPACQQMFKALADASGC